MALYTRLSIAALLICAHVHPANAENIAGVVSITPSPWYVKVHASPSYGALAKIKTKMSSGDFYSSINFIPQFDSSPQKCGSDSDSINNFFKALIGTTSTSMYIVTLTASLGQGVAGQYNFMTNTPLFMAGTGIDPSSNTASVNGCFFSYLPLTREPFVRYDGSFNEGYTLSFKVFEAQSLSVNAVATLKDVATAVMSAATIQNPTAAQVTAFAAAASDLQDKINTAGTSAKSLPVQKLLLTAGQKNMAYHLWSNMLASTHGNMVIYARLSASFILDEMGDTLDPEAVLSNNKVGSPPCLPALPTPIATCSGATLKTFPEAYKAHASDMLPLFFDVTDPVHKKMVYNTCSDLRLFASGQLRLSTLDALLVRWAAVKLGRLDRVLADASARADLAKAAGVLPADLDLCWNTKDQQLLDQVLKNMGKSIANG